MTERRHDELRLDTTGVFLVDGAQFTDNASRFHVNRSVRATARIAVSPMLFRRHSAFRGHRRAERITRAVKGRRRRRGWPRERQEATAQTNGLAIDWRHLPALARQHLVREERSERLTRFPRQRRVATPSHVRVV